jgi:hypothetical protein
MRFVSAKKKGKKEMGSAFFQIEPQRFTKNDRKIISSA